MKEVPLTRGSTASESPMPETCPDCGATMLDDTEAGMAQTARCSACQYQCVLANDNGYLFLTEWSHEGTMSMTDMSEQIGGG